MSHRNYIDLSKVYNTTSLATREAARVVSRLIAERNSNQIELDFISIEYTSLSFLDELNSILKKMDNEVNVTIINLNEELKLLQKKIEDRVGRKKSAKSDVIAEPKILEL